MKPCRITLTFILSLWCLTPAGAANISPSSMLERGEKLTIAGKYREAEKVYDSILNLPSLRKSFEFQALDGRGRCRKLLAEYGKATEDYDRALQLPASPLNRATIALNKSDLLITTGQYNTAERLLREVDTISDLPIQLKRRLFANLASIKKYEGKFDLSIDIYNSILKMETSPAEKARTLQNLGILYLDRNDIRNAVSSLEEAYSILSSNEGEPETSAIVLTNLALAYASAGRSDEALNNIEKSLQIIQQHLGTDHPDYLTALRKRGEIHLLAGDKEMATETFRPYFAHLHSYILRTLPSMTEQARLDYWKKERPLISEVFATEESDPEFLADVALLRRAIALTGADKAFGGRSTDKLAVTARSIKKNLRKNEIGVDFVIYPEISQDLRRVDKLAAIIIYPEKSGLSPKFIPYGEVKEFENRKIGNRTLLTSLRSTRADDKNRIYSDTTLFPALWGKVIENIPDGSTVYFVPDGFLNLLALESLPTSELNGKGKSLSFRRLSTLATLLNRTTPPQARKGTANGKMLVAGGFNYDDLPLNVDSDSTVEIPNHDAYNFLINNLSGRFSGFETLSGMKEETSTIAEIMSWASSTDTMTEEKFKQLIPTINALHLATHGYTIDNKETTVTFSMRDSIEADNSLLASGLVLSGANIASKYPDRDDGLLSARELCDLDLSAINCIVLAACQTAIGEVADEGPAGLLRGLKKAGAATVLATLWEVDDNATLLFMTEFYKAIKNGKQYGEAYEAARQGVRSHKLTEPVIVQRFDPATLCTVYEETGETEEVYPFEQPAYWAPFILVDATE